MGRTYEARPTADDRRRRPALSAAGLVLAGSSGAAAAEPTPQSSGQHNFEARDYNGVPNGDSAKSVSEANQTGDDLGTACYKRADDIFFVRDDEQDGHRVTVYWAMEDSNILERGNTVRSAS